MLPEKHQLSKRNSMNNIHPFNLHTIKKFTNFLDCIGEIHDPRLNRCKKHSLENIIVIIVFSMLGGANTASAIANFGRRHIDWFRSILELKNGIPSHDTIERALKFIKPEELSFWINMWIEEYSGNDEFEHIAIDGKEDRANQFYCARALNVKKTVVLAHVPIPKNANEITIASDLLEKINLKNKIVTGDAIYNQRKIARKIIDGGADYVLALKKNQGDLHEDVKFYLDEIEKDPDLLGSFDKYRTLDKSHGRVEERICISTDQIGWISQRSKWKKLKSISVIKSSITVNNKTSTSFRYYISSLKPNAKRIGGLVRDHWAIENQCHRTLDTNFGSDLSTFKDYRASLNLAVFKDLALFLLKNYDSEKRLANAYRIDTLIETFLHSGI